MTWKKLKPGAGIAIALGLLFGGCYGAAQIQVADGYRDSTIRKLSESGIIWKTWEVESLGEGLRATSNDAGTKVSPETFEYSLNDASLLPQIQNVPPGKPVRIHYRKQLMTWMPRGETRYFITRVEQVPE